MPSIDWPLEELRVYVPPPTAPDDLDEFWTQTLAEQNHPFDADHCAGGLPGCRV